MYSSLWEQNQRPKLRENMYHSFISLKSLTPRFVVLRTWALEPTPRSDIPDGEIRPIS